MNRTLTPGGETWCPGAGTEKGEARTTGLPAGLIGRKEAVFLQGPAGKILNAANLLFVALMVLQLLPSRRPDEDALPFTGVLVLSEAGLLAYSFLKSEPDKVRTMKDLFVIFFGAAFTWDLLTARTNLLDRMLFPSPAFVLRLMAAEIPAFLTGLASSLKILVVGYGAAVVLGTGLGLAFGWRARLRSLATPLTRILGPIPPTVYIPYAIVLLPTFTLSSMFVIFVGAFWPIFINTMNGVRGIEARIIDSARVLNLNDRTMLIKVILPGTLPSVMTGATIGLAMSFILLTAAEMIGATSGLGWYVKYFSDFADYPRVIVGIFFAGIVVTLIMYAFDRVEKRLLRWRK